MKMRDFVPTENAVVTGGAARNVESGSQRPKGPYLAKIQAAVTALACLMLLAGCESNPPQSSQAKPEVKPTESLTARAASETLYRGPQLRS